MTKNQRYEMTRVRNVLLQQQQQMLDELASQSNRIEHTMDFHQVKDDFSSLVLQCQPWMLTQFVMWLDVKLAEYKVNGFMALDKSRKTIPRWIEEDIYNITARIAPKPPPCKTCTVTSNPECTNMTEAADVGLEHETVCDTENESGEISSRSLSNVQYSVMSTKGTGYPNASVLISDESSDSVINTTRPPAITRTKPNTNTGVFTCGSSQAEVKSRVPRTNSRSPKPPVIRVCNSLIQSEASETQTTQEQSNSVPPEDSEMDIMINVKQEVAEYLPDVERTIQQYENPTLDYRVDAANSDPLTDHPVFPVSLYELQSGTDDLNKQVSVSGKIITLPHIYDKYVKRRLENGEAKNVWSRVICICSEHLMDITDGQPTSSDYQVFSKMFYLAYPSVGSDKGRHPWTIFKKTLSQKIRHLRYMRKKGILLNSTASF